MNMTEEQQKQINEASKRYCKSQEWEHEWYKVMESFQAGAEFCVSLFNEKDIEISALKEKITAIKKAILTYRHSEGCDCCEGTTHEDDRDYLAKILDVPMYEDKSGYDWDNMAF